MKGQNTIRLLAVGSLSVLLGLLHYEWRLDADEKWLPFWFRGIFLLFCGLCTIVTLRISFLPASRFTPAHIIILQYFVDCLISSLGAYYSKKLENQTKRCQEEQEQFLMDLLAKRAATKYGKDKGFASVKSSGQFRKEHPLTVHSDYEPYLTKAIEDSEDDVMIPGRPFKLCLTSGTTGQRKRVISSKKRVRLFAQKFVPIGQRMLRKRILSSYSPLLKTCYIYTHTQPRYTSSGITIGPTTMLILPDLLYRIQYSTPPIGMRLTNEKQATYVHLLFALRDRDLQAIFAIFAATLYYTFHLLEKQWPSLVDDLREGRINDSIDLDADVKVTLEQELQPDPIRANELEAEFRKGFNGIVGRIWPRMTSFWGVTSGSMTVYEDILRVKYIKDLPVASMIYNSTECLLGMLNGGAERTEYITFPADVFYEFIPFENSIQKQPQTLLANEVTVGAYYEVVVTTIDGLYRYRIGDVVKVTGFYNKAPIIEFGHRVGDVLNVHGERTPEIMIKAALQEALSRYDGFHLVDFTCLEGSFLGTVQGVSKSQGAEHYVVFAEVDGLDKEVKDHQEIRKLFSDIDLELCNLSDKYSDHRKKDLVRELQLILVKSETFKEFRILLSQKAHGSTMQVKVPKVLKIEEFVDFFLQRKIETKA